MLVLLNNLKMFDQAFESGNYFFEFSNIIEVLR